jgi:hypothetical protein
MKRIPALTALIMVLCMCPLFADMSTVTIASVVDGRPQVNPNIVIGIGSIQLTYHVESELDTTTVSGLDLSQDGSFTFAMLTSEEVRIFTESQKYGLTIEIVADGFHLYGEGDGNSSDSLVLKKANVVPLLTTRPDVEIPEFGGTDENVEVWHSGGNNRIEVRFNRGTTRSDLILGTFNIGWKGVSPLEEGVYKAKVSVVYSTP